ncbi:hypothetical protein BH10BAC2_BH10BAC2_02130 [soil metagenome]
MEHHLIQRDISEIKEYILCQLSLKKEILNFQEAAVFLGISKSSLYKITSTRRIPFYVPSGKLLYFKKKELEDWLLQNRHATKGEISDDVMNKKKHNRYDKKRI